MDYLPNEMIVHILYFVHDRVYTSMACSKFNQILLKMIETNQITNYNDPYVLSKKCKNIPHYFGDDLKQNLPHIMNHKSLDYICFKCNGNYYGYSWDVGIFMLLKQCCVTDYAYHEQNIINMFKCSKNLMYEPLWNYRELLNIAFNHKSWKIISTLMKIKSVRQEWRNSFCERYQTENNIDIIIDEINCLVERGNIDYKYVFTNIWCLYDNQLKLRDKLLECLSSKMDTQFKIEI